MNFAVTVAGFDGSAGAGILADIKAMRDFGVYGVAACSALTVQNECSFESPGFLPAERILEQLDKLREVREYRFYKIGLVRDVETLRLIVEWIRSHSRDTFILWDPIMAASAGFRFFAEADAEKFRAVMAQIDLITPNRLEFAYLGFAISGESFVPFCPSSVLLKGGHATGEEAVDILWWRGKRYEFSSRRLVGVDKHGTGCTLSAAILANLTLGKSLPESCQAAKLYMENFLVGGEGRIGWVDDFVPTSLR